MDIDLLKILFIILCFQFLFTSLFLFQNKKGKRLSNGLLALVFIMISMAVVDLYLVVFRVEFKFPQLLFVVDTFMFAYGPLLFFFTRSVIFKNYRLQNKSIVHFIPFLIAICMVVGLMIFEDTSSISKAVNEINTQQVPISFRIGELLMLSHILCYLIASKQAIKKVVGKSKDLFSTFNQDKFELLKFILNAFIILFLISFLHSILPFIGIKNGLLFTLLALVLFMFYFINSILLKLLNQSSNDSSAITQAHFKEKEKYAGSKLSPSDIKDYMDKLSSYMNEKQRYLDSELSITNLSSELNMSSKILSQVINEGHSCNFFDFVNTYRVEAAKALFKDQADKKLTIQQVMYDSGFNSKSSFNTAFKKFTKQTPTQFRNSL